MARKTREVLTAELGEAVRGAQAAVDEHDEAVALHLGVNRTDLRCLELLLFELSGSTPGQLGARLSLTTGSVTAMLDRLARLGYLTRMADAADRRKVIVRATPLLGERTGALYGPLVSAGERLVGAYTVAELELLIDFQRRSRAVQEENTARVRALPVP